MTQTVERDVLEELATVRRDNSGPRSRPDFHLLEILARIPEPFDPTERWGTL